MLQLACNPRPPVDRLSMATADDADAYARRLDAVLDLLPVLVAAPDVPEICTHLSALSPQIVRHDEMTLALLTQDGAQRTWYSENGNPTVVADTTCPAEDPGEAQVVDDTRSDGTAWSRVSAPVRIKGHAVGVLAFHARRPAGYVTDDAGLLRHLPDCVAIAVSHQQLAESARVAAQERARITDIETSM